MASHVPFPGQTSGHARRSGGLTGKSDASKYQRRKLLSLGGSVLVSLSAGSNYAFSSFAPQLQESLHLTSTQLNVVGVLGNMGVYLSGPLWGKYVDKHGPKVALLAGAIMVICGYGGLSLSHTHSYPQGSAVAPAALNLLSGIGNCAAFTAAMSAQAKSFSGSQRGSATALVLAGFGLSAFMYSTLSHELFPGNTSDYLLLLAFGSAASFLLGILLIKIMPSHEAPTETAPSSARDQDVETGGRPALYSRRRTSSDLDAQAYILSDDEDDDDEEDGQRAAAGGSNGEESRGLLNGDHAKAKSPEDAINITGWKLLRQTDFHFLFFIMCLISGSGLLLINNVGTITRTLWEFNHGPGFNHGPNAIVPPVAGAGAAAAAKGPVDAVVSASRFSGWMMRTGEIVADAAMEAFKHDENGRIQQEQAHQVSAISIGNASGRVLIGFLSDVWVGYMGSAKYRVWLLLPVTLLAFSSQFLFALPDTINDVKMLLIGSSLTGLAYGALHGVAPCLTFEWFGTKHSAKNWSLVALAPVISGNLFNLLFGKIFDSHVPADAPSHQCPEGEDCYRTAFKVTSCATALSIAVAMTIIVRRVGLLPQRGQAE